MTYKVPEKSKTRKRNSLPDDLKSIADDLIKDKFKEKEVVRKNSVPNPFKDGQQPVAYFNGNTGDVGTFRGESITSASVDHGRYGRRGLVRIEDRIDTRSRVAYASIKYSGKDVLRGIADAMRALDEENLPHRGRTIFVSPYAWNEIRREGAFALLEREGAYPVLWGAEVRDCPPEMMEHVRLEF